jgi:lipoprotein-releasing system ATP-binding protein
MSDVLEARNINKYYTNGKERLHVLKDVSLKIARGEIISVLGPSGAGKSTLLHILGGLDTPTSGEIFFEGKAFKNLSQSELSGVRNEAVGFVFQFYHLMPEFTVLENVMMPALIGRRQAAAGSRPQEKALGLLKEVGLSHRIRHFPGQLSGGEQQRVAIARALMNMPELLLCDEPTGNLDSENGKQICQLLKKLNQERKMTIVLVTHNLEVAGFGFKVYNMIDGLIRPESGGAH